MIFRSSLRLVSLLAVIFLIPACGGSSGGGDDGGGKWSSSENGIVLHEVDGTLDATKSASVVNPFWFEDGQQLKATVIGGWANDRGPGTFGVITARLSFDGPDGGTVEPGSYALHGGSPYADGDPMTAGLVFEYDGKRMTSDSGSLTLDAIQGNPGLQVLRLSFEGEFSEEDGGELHPISGTINISSK